MASTFDIGGGQRSKNKLGLRLSWGGGGGVVHGNSIWPMDSLVVIAAVLAKTAADTDALVTGVGKTSVLFPA